MTVASPRPAPDPIAPTGDGDRSFELDGLHGRLAAWIDPRSTEAVVRQVIDPATATETLHWGRNYLYVTSLDAEVLDRAALAAAGLAGAPDDAGRLEVVVKQFRNDKLAERLRRRWRGDKATRSWTMARRLGELGIATPAPVALVLSDDPDGPSHYVSRRLEGTVELRYLLRAATVEREQELFPRLDLLRVLEGLADLVRRLHGAGIWFRDLTSGNVLVERRADGEPELHLVDLNRARPGQTMTVRKRTMDLHRMPITRREHQEHFVEAYWTGVAAETGTEAATKPPWWRTKWFLYRLFHRGFRLKNDLKKTLRGKKRRESKISGKVMARSTHAHIPEAPEGASTRERVVWDHLSDQPHLHAGPWEKLAVRLRDAGVWVEELAALARTAPAIRRRYRELAADLWTTPRPFTGAGVALRPWPRDPEALLGLVDDLGLAHALVRLHPWDADGRDAEEELAAALAGRGLEVSFAVPQNRDLVRDPAAWRAALDEIAERFTPHGRAFQVGQAINRSKWGVWSVDEYVELVRGARAALEAVRPDVEILGPGVIDFELHRTAAVVNLRREGLAFDALASLLYVDRRGAPEQTQMGFDTLGKAMLVKAIADTGANVAGRSWITEVNWPLWEGPHSPAGRAVSVDEQTQASYLVRYLLATLGTGLVERVFWWQMIARGYGLVCPEDDGATLRRRPSFAALATVERLLGGSLHAGPVIEGEAAPRSDEGGPDPRLHRFLCDDGTTVAVAWNAGHGQATIDLPTRPVAAWGRDGAEEHPPEETTISVGPEPRYLGFEGSPFEDG